MTVGGRRYRSGVHEARVRHDESERIFEQVCTRSLTGRLPQAVNQLIEFDPVSRVPGTTVGRIVGGRHGHGLTRIVDLMAEKEV
jgi:hypothetical protein